MTKSSAPKMHTIQQVLILLVALPVVFILAQDSPEYEAHMSKLMNISANQTATYLLGSFPLPSHINANPSTTDWIFDNSVQPRKAVITHCNRGSCFYTTMEIVPGQYWLQANKTKLIEMYNHTTGARTHLVVEDIRVFIFEGTMHMAYNIHPKGSVKLFYYAALHYDDAIDMFYEDNRIRINIEHEAGHRSQKNWSPFSVPLDARIQAAAKVVPAVGSNVAVVPSVASKHNALLFVYSIFPHRIVHVNETTADPHVMNAHTVCSTQITRPGLVAANRTSFERSLWPWGEPRGGTQAELVDTPYGPKYLTFFHSSGRFVMKWLQTYYMGAYLFDPSPPFAITHMTPDPIIPNEFYNQTFGWAYKRLDYIIFPMGFLVRGEKIYMTTGKNDHAAWVVTFNKTAFLSSLRPVQSETIIDRYSAHFADVTKMSGTPGRISGTDKVAKINQTALL